MVRLGFSVNPFKEHKYCVYKLFYGDRYVIIKAKFCAGSLKAIQKSLNQYLRGSESQRDPQINRLYIKLFKYIENNPGLDFSAVVVFQSVDENDYQCLVMEQMYLYRARNDRRCLNNLTQSYICKWNAETGMFNWLKRGSVLNFYRYTGDIRNTISAYVPEESGKGKKKGAAGKGKSKSKSKSKSTGSASSGKSKSGAKGKGKKNIRKKSKSATAKKSSKKSKAAPKKKTTAPKAVPKKAVSKKPAAKKQTKKKK